MKPLERRIWQLLWVALFIATCIYGVIDWIVVGAHVPLHTLEEELKSMFVLTLYALGVVTFLMAMSVAASNRTRYIARLALFESTTLFGLVAAFVTSDWRLFLPTWALSVIGFLQSLPPSAEERYTPAP